MKNQIAAERHPVHAPDEKTTRRIRAKKKAGTLKKLGKIGFIIGFSFFYQMGNICSKKGNLAVLKILKNRMAGCDSES